MSATDASQPVRVPLWPKEALRPAARTVANVDEKARGDDRLPPRPEAKPAASTAPAAPAKKVPLSERLPHGPGAGKSVFGSEAPASPIVTAKPAGQGAGKILSAPHASPEAVSPERPKTVLEARAGQLTAESQAHLKLQKERMERAGRDAERARLARELARAESVLFIKRQELQRVEIRWRAVESATRAAEVQQKRAKSDHEAASTALRERTNERERLEAQLEGAERDFDRRLLAEKKAVEGAGREIVSLRRDGYGDSSRASELAVRKQARERGGLSIERERVRRRAELSSRIAAVGREAVRYHGLATRAERELALAESLLTRYAREAHGLESSKVTVESDLERERHGVERLRADLARLGH